MNSNENLLSLYEKVKNGIQAIIDEELPDEEICETCDIYDVNGIVIKERLQLFLTELEKLTGDFL